MLRSEVLHGHCLEVMHRRDDDSVGNPVAVTDLAAGIAGEHLVCADLLLSGWRAFLADQNCPYDVAVEVGQRLVRVQVKTTRSPRPVPQRKQHIPGNYWQVRRAGKRGRRSYGDDEFDIAALVALDTREIAYVPLADCPQTFCIRPTAAPGYEKIGSCEGCGCDFADRTPGCRACRGRHWRRARAGAGGKRFASYPFYRALAALKERG